MPPNRWGWGLGWVWVWGSGWVVGLGRTAQRDGRSGQQREEQEDHGGAEFGRSPSSCSHGLTPQTGATINVSFLRTGFVSGQKQCVNLRQKASVIWSCKGVEVDMGAVLVSR